MFTKADKLVAALCKSSVSANGCGILVLCDGKFHRFNSGIDASKFLTLHLGRKLRYRTSGFADGSHTGMAAVIA